MNVAFNRLMLVCLCAVSGYCSNAQEGWPSPEVEQMFHHAQEYAALGNFRDAVITYRQAILIAPGKTILYKELGRVQFLSADFVGAEKTLIPLQTKNEADAECLQILAMSQSAENKSKNAKKTLQKGLVLFPASGLLYNELGREYATEKKHENALNAWLDGISNDPVFAKNYFDAAATYLNSDKVLWGIIYGELFLNLDHDTTADDTMKKMLYTGYKKMFDNIGNGPSAYGNAKKETGISTFEAAVTKVFIVLTPVVSDGMSTENLVMVRTRFAMDWSSEYAAKYPFSLFSWQDELLKNGRFEIYNEWLFGKAENEQQFEAWNNFHAGDIDRFRAWRKTHEIKPVKQDFYNDRNMVGMFTKRKK